MFVIKENLSSAIWLDAFCSKMFVRVIQTANSGLPIFTAHICLMLTISTQRQYTKFVHCDQ